jgi:hypothetical protein
MTTTARVKARVAEGRYRERNRATLAEKQQARQQRNRAWLTEIKGTTCEDCGLEFEPHLLHFHHRDPETKCFGIGDNMTRSRAKVLAEIAKCDVICGACHMRITFGRV